MSEQLVLGPLLSLENDNKYVVCFLSKTNQEYSVMFNDKISKALKLGHLKSGYLYRAEYTIQKKKKEQKIEYHIANNEGLVKDSHDRDTWSFTVPSSKEKINFVYESYEKLLNSEQLQRELDAPHDLLILNEFKLLDDDVYSKLNKIKDITKRDLDNFFEKRYIEKLNNSNISMILATIPNIIMKQDHTLLRNDFDDEINYFEDINTSCKKYFEIFQLRTIKNNTLLTKDRTHYSFALKCGDHQILSIDDNSLKNQSEIISDYLENRKEEDKLFILCDKSNNIQSL